MVAAGRGHKWLPHFAQSTPETVWGYYGLTPEQAAQAQENRRLAGELDAAVTKLADADGARSEIDALRQERDQVRSRVAGILEHLEGLDI